MRAKIETGTMTAPMMMPAFAPEPRLASFLLVDWLVEDCTCVTVTILAVSVIAEVVGEDLEKKDVEVKDKMVGSDNVEEPEIIFNWSSGVAWKFSSLGFEQSMNVEEGVAAQQAHNSVVLLWTISG